VALIVVVVVALIVVVVVALRVVVVPLMIEVVGVPLHVPLTQLDCWVLASPQCRVKKFPSY
jgi:hypothetical protein